MDIITQVGALALVGTLGTGMFILDGIIPLLITMVTTGDIILTDITMATITIIIMLVITMDLMAYLVTEEQEEHLVIKLEM
jgi:hypothetical protein